MIKRMIVLNICVIFVLGFMAPDHTAASPAPAEAVEELQESLATEGISPESWSSMQAQMAAAQYHFTWQEPSEGKGAYRAPNPELGLGVGFGPTGLQVWPLADSEEQLGLLLNTAAGESLAVGDFSAARGQVTRQVGSLQEVLESNEDGIRYSLTLAAPSQGESLNLFYQMSGDLVPLLSGESLEVQNANGHAVFRLGELTALDAAGQSYPAAFSLEGDLLTVKVKDVKNAYLPLTIKMRVWTEGVKLMASDAQADDQFGFSVAASGDVVVVSAYAEDTEGADAGAAYVFQRMQDGADAWGEVTKLTASDAAAGDYFGTSVGVSGDVIVVGAFQSGSGGTAYVFQRMEGGADAWGEVAKLTPSIVGADYRFGYAVAVSGDVIVVGAKRELVTSHALAGAAYVFQRMEGGADAWGEVARLTASDDDYSDRFGWSVAVSGDVIVVGAERKASNTGAAYVFQRMQGGADAWGQVAKLTASDASSGDYFGHSVGVSGDVIVVSANGEDAEGTDAGAAYVFQRMEGGTDAWGEVVKLTASDATADDHFGISVAVSGDVIVVGSWGQDSAASDAGATYIFHRLQGGSDGWGEVNKLTASDAGADDTFGFSVAVSGDVVVVGARREDNGGSDAGAAYIFQDDADNWRETAKKAVLDAQPSDNFGTSVGISGDVIVVGSPRGGCHSDNVPGEAYVFQRMQDGMDTWGEVVKLTASDAAERDYFGISVGVSGDVIVVGAFGPDPYAGAAYVFQRMQVGTDAWGEVVKLTASDTQAGDQFGNKVAVSGDVIVVGAPYEDTGGSNAGAAYVYQRMKGGADTWGEVTKLPASDAAADDHFGISVGVSGDLIVVGASGDDASGSNAGAAYVFQRMKYGVDTWGEDTKLTASDADADDYFGGSVSVSGDVIVVGANREDTEGEDAGAAYIFQRMEDGTDAWGEVAKLTASDASEGDWFSNSVAVSGDVIVVGSYGEDTGGQSAGAAYVFQRMQGGVDTWGEVTKLMASDAAENDIFGGSVAVSGDVIVVGAYIKDKGVIQDAGAVYIFQPDLAEADLSLTKTEDVDPVYAGETLTYTLSVSNAGPSDAENLVVTDTLPGGVTFQAASGTGWSCGESSGVVSCTRPSLAVGDAPDITVTVTTPAAAGVITNSASVTSDTFDPDEENNDDECQTTVLGVADLSLTTTEDVDPVYAGETLTYTLTVSNDGPSDAENLTVSDTLPGGVTFQSASGDGWTCGEDSGVVTCTRATLPVGDAPDITITVTAPAAADVITNSASVVSDTYDPDEINNSDDCQTTVQSAADLSLTKTDSPDPVAVGGTLTYTLTVNNAGPSDAENLTVTDTLPESVTFLSASGEGWSCEEVWGEVICARTSLAVGDAPDITINVTAPNTPGDITNGAWVMSDTFELFVGNNSDGCQTTVQAAADLSLTKTEDVDPVYAGETLSYTLTVNNAGPSVAENPTVDDILPGGVTFLSAEGTNWTCDEGSGVVTCTRASLEVGDAPDITITVTAPSTAGDITNSASVTSDTYDPDEENNDDECQTTVIWWEIFIPMILR